MKCMVVIPTYNERDNIEPLVDKILGLGDHFHVTIVDDNSPDGTGEIAERLATTTPRVQVIHRPAKQGLGTAYIAGFKHALKNGVDYVVEMDADFSHDPDSLPGFLELMDTYDVVIGSRYVKGLAVVNWSLRRLFLSLSANLYARWITGLPLHDCTSGFKCFKRAVLESIDLDDIFANGYAFQVEMNYRAHSLGYRVGEMPIIFFDRHAGQSKMSSKIAREAFWQILKMRVSHILRLGNFARRTSGRASIAARPGIESS
ncbi:MAG: polyprenol monophosphomannose synthase [Chloroflexi bacterium]|nr:MAG: polyprenol monophosphomannose synthase [Chloroflexota bacterium]